MCRVVFSGTGMCELREGHAGSCAIRFRRPAGGFGFLGVEVLGKENVRAPLNGRGHLLYPGDRTGQPRPDKPKGMTAKKE